MAKAFRVVSWNVEHFKGDPQRLKRVVQLLNDQNPDVFALYEVEGKAVFTELTTKMPGYSFHITEGPQVQEILVGVKKNFTAFFTQKLAFKGGVDALRPGAIVTITLDGHNYTLLFLHTKSGNNPRGFGIRDDMLFKAVKFQSTLNKAVTGTAHYMFLGDLNTMGMTYSYARKEDVEFENEMKRLKGHAKRRGMRILNKDEDFTWWNGPGTSLPKSNLDHVVASNHLQFKQFNGADVRVDGWPKESTDTKAGQWIGKFSDHGLMVFEVQKV